MNKEIKGIDGIPVFSWNTETKEFYVLGQKFDGVNSIEDFINYIAKLQQIEKEHQNCTRKHWQQKCFEHSANEKIYKSRCEKAIEEYTKTYRTIYYTMKYYRDSKQIEKCDILYNDCIKKLDELDLLNILKGSDENE